MGSAPWCPCQVQGWLCLPPALVSPSWGALCAGSCPAGSAIPHPVSPSNNNIPPLPPHCLSGFLRSKTVPVASPGPCAFVSPSPAGARGGGPVPRDAPKSLACPPASSLPSVAAWLCPSPLQLATGTNWDKGLVGAARSACCWQQAAEPLPALCLHELEGSRQCAVHGCLAHALAPCPWRAPKMAVPRPHLLPVGPWGEGIFFQLHPGFVVFSPCPCSAARGYRPLPGWGAAPRDSWCVCPPPTPPCPGAHSPPLLMDDSGTTWCNFCDFCIF